MKNTVTDTDANFVSGFIERENGESEIAFAMRCLSTADATVIPRKTRLPNILKIGSKWLRFSVDRMSATWTINKRE